MLYPTREVPESFVVLRNLAVREFGKDESERNANCSWSFSSIFFSDSNKFCSGYEKKIEALSSSNFPIRLRSLESDIKKFKEKLKKLGKNKCKLALEAMGKNILLCMLQHILKIDIFFLRICENYFNSLLVF